MVRTERVTGQAFAFTTIAIDKQLNTAIAELESVGGRIKEVLLIKAEQDTDDCAFLIVYEMEDGQ